MSESTAPVEPDESEQKRSQRALVNQLNQAIIDLRRDRDMCEQTCPPRK